MSGVLGAIGMAGLDVAADTVSNWLQGKMDLDNSRKLMRFQTDQQLKAQSILNQRLYPQTIASMRMAGLNPAMVNGPLGATSASMPSATQNKQAARMNLGEAAAATAQLSKLESEIDVNKATAENIRADSENKLQDTRNKRLEEDLLGNRLFTWFQDWTYEKNYQASQSYLFNEQGDFYKNQARLSDREAKVAEERINEVRESVLNLAETRKKIKAEAALTWSKKEGQDKINAKYDELTDASIEQMKSYSSFMDHDDQRQAALIVKRLVQLDIQNENAVWETEILKELKQARSFQNYLNMKYGDDDRFLNQVSTVLNSASNGYRSLTGNSDSSTMTNYYDADGVHTGSKETITTH